MELGGHFPWNLRSLPSLVNVAVLVAGCNVETSTDFQNTCLLTINITINTEVKLSIHVRRRILRWRMTGQSPKESCVKSSQHCVATGLASYPGSRWAWKERAHCLHMRTISQKSWEIVNYCVISVQPWRHNVYYHTSNSCECMGVNGEAFQLHSVYFLLQFTREFVSVLL